MAGGRIAHRAIGRRRWRLGAVGAVVAYALAAATPAVVATETERHYLSGSGLGDTVEWQFRISDGRRSGSWSKIAVPSQWQLEGFGTYAYGWQEDKPRAEGRRWLGSLKRMPNAPLQPVSL